MQAGSKRRESWDVVVIGAGPAGAAAAVSSARDGMSVLLVDAKWFPRRKACGGCLNGNSVRRVQQLLGDRHPLWDSALPLGSFRLVHRGRVFNLETPRGLAIDRAALDQSLVLAAERSGATFRPSTTAKVASICSHFRQVELTTEGLLSTVDAKVVVLASGLGSRAAGTNNALHQRAKPTSRVGIEAIFENFPDQYAEGAIHMVVGRQGYVGLTQACGRRLHVAAAVDRLALQQLGPDVLSQSILRSAGAAELQDKPVGGWRGTPPLTARPKRLAGERIFLIGDAAGYVEPFTGEGIRWALETGIGVAPFVAESRVAWHDSLIAHWEAWYRRHIESQQRLCSLLSRGLKNSPARWLAHYALSTQPKLASMIIARLNQESGK